MSRRRIAFFIAGTVLGSVFVYYVLIKGKKFPAWLPKDRIKEQIKETPLELSARTQCMLNCYGIKAEEISAVVDNGEVDLGDSKPRRNPRPIYAIDGKTTSGVAVRIYTETNTFRNITTILSIDKKEPALGDKCDCPALNLEDQPDSTQKK